MISSLPTSEMPPTLLRKQEKISKSFPRGVTIETNQRKAWTIVVGLAAACSVILGTTLCSLGVLLLPVIEGLGGTTAQASRAATFFVVAMTVAMPVAGWLLDRMAARGVNDRRGPYGAGRSSLLQKARASECLRDDGP